MPNFVSIEASNSIAELAHGEKLRTQSLNQSLTHPAYLKPREPKLLLQNLCTNMTTYVFLTSLTILLDLLFPEKSSETDGAIWEHFATSDQQYYRNSSRIRDNYFRMYDYVNCVKAYNDKLTDRCRTYPETAVQHPRTAVTVPDQRRMRGRRRCPCSQRSCPDNQRL